MQSSNEALPPSALLLWADSLPYCTGLLYQPAMLKMSKTLLTGVQSKNGKKHKCSLSLSNVSFYTHELQIRGCPRDPPLRPLAVENGVWVREGGPLLVPPSTCLASRWNGLPQAMRAGLGMAKL
jgi:hypothetical protein